MGASGQGNEPRDGGMPGNGSHWSARAATEPVCGGSSMGQELKDEAGYDVVGVLAPLGTATQGSAGGKNAAGIDGMHVVSGTPADNGNA